MRQTRKLRVGENLFTWLLMLLSLFVFYEAYLISGFHALDSPGTFPLMAAGIMIFTAGLVLLENRKQEKPDVPNLRAELSRAGREVLPPVFLIYIIIVIAYAILIEPLHFLPSSFLFLFASMAFLRGSGIIKSLVISAGTLVCIYIIFQTLFRVILP
jgi:putative tricarboxylic transport membrane protein